MRSGKLVFILMLIAAVSLPVAAKQPWVKVSKKPSHVKTSLIGVNHNTFSSVGYPQTFRFSPDGSHFMLREGNHIRIWNSKSSLICDYQHFTSDLLSADLVGDSRKIVLSGKEGRMYIYDFQGNALSLIQYPSNSWAKRDFTHGTIERVIFFPDGKRIITIKGSISFPGKTSQHKIQVRDSQWNVLKEHFILDYYTLHDVVIDPKGRYFAVVHGALETEKGWKATVRLYNRNGRFIRDIENSKPVRISTAQGRKRKKFWSPVTVMFSPDGRYILYWNKYSRDIRVVDVRKGSTFQFEADEKQYVKHADFDRTSSRIYAFYRDGFKIFNLNGKMVNSIDSADYKKHAGYYSTIHLSPDKKYFVAFFRNIAFFDLKGNLIKNIEGVKRTSFTSVDVSPRGSKIVMEITRGKKSLVWDTPRNNVSEIDSSSGFDRFGKQYFFTVKRKSASIKFYGTREIVLRSDEFSYPGSYAFPLKNRQFGHISSNYIIYNRNADPVRVVKKANQSSVFSPNMKYYLGPAPFGMEERCPALYSLSGKRLIRFPETYYSTYIFNSTGSKVFIAKQHLAKVMIYSVKGKKLREFRHSHVGFISSMALTNDDRFLVTLSTKNKSFYIHDLKKPGWLKVTFYRDYSWIVSSSDGYFDYSGKRDRDVSITENGRDATGKYIRSRRKPGLLQYFLGSR